MDVGALDAIDGELDQTVVDQDDGPRLDDLGEACARLGDAAIGAFDLALG